MKKKIILGIAILCMVYFAGLLSHTTSSPDTSTHDLITLENSDIEYYLYAFSDNITKSSSSVYSINFVGTYSDTHDYSDSTYLGAYGQANPTPIGYANIYLRFNASAWVSNPNIDNITLHNWYYGKSGGTRHFPISLSIYAYSNSSWVDLHSHSATGNYEVIDTLNNSNGFTDW